MYADGSGLTQLTHSIASRKRALSPNWSPDGTQIAFQGADVPDAGTDLFVMDADGTNAVRLTRGMDPGPPAWSPDGTRIAFCLAEGGDWASIYTINVDGTNLTRLTWGDDASGDPAWSPDGTRIAFTQWISVDPGDTPIETYYAIWVMNADGSHIVHLTDPAGLFVSGPAWSPDGTQIAFACEQPEGGREICVIDIDGANRRQLPMPTESHPCRRMGHPTWSPDSQFIAFECEEDTDTIFIWTMNADGSNVVRLTEGYQPAWQSGRNTE
jgi:TolB protein